MLSILFSRPDRLYTISGSLRDTLPPKEAHIEMWDIETLLLWTLRLRLFRHTTLPLVITLCLTFVSESSTFCLKPPLQRPEFSLTPGVIFTKLLCVVLHFVLQYHRYTVSHVLLINCCCTTWIRIESSMTFKTCMNPDMWSCCTNIAFIFERISWM